MGMPTLTRKWNKLPVCCGIRFIFFTLSVGGSVWAVCGHQNFLSSLYRPCDYVGALVGFAASCKHYQVHLEAMVHHALVRFVASVKQLGWESVNVKATILHWIASSQFKRCSGSEAQKSDYPRILLIDESKMGQDCDRWICADYQTTEVEISLKAKLLHFIPSFTYVH